MAKELPYFKFEPNQWENGNIQICSREDKGLFIDLCSMYWSRLGELPFKLAVQKLCAGNATALNSLCEENIIEVVEGNIFIKFLSEQLNEFEDTSKQNSKNAKEGWEKRRKQKELSERNATASNPQSESDAIREEKIREEDIKVTPTKVEKIDFDILLKFICDTTERQYRTISAKVKQSFNARIKEGYTKVDIMNAIKNACKNQFHLDNGRQYLTPEFFSRSATLEKFSSVAKPVAQFDPNANPVN